MFPGYRKVLDTCFSAPSWLRTAVIVLAMILLRGSLPQTAESTHGRAAEALTEATSFRFDHTELLTYKPLDLAASSSNLWQFPFAWHTEYTKALVTPVYVGSYAQPLVFGSLKFCALGTYKAVDSRGSEDAAASELNHDEDTLRDAVLCLSQETRELVEKSLLKKLDTRMSILVLIYILNFVSYLYVCLLFM